MTRGKALHAQQKYAEALALVERAAQLDPNSFEAWANRADALFNLNRLGESLDACERALALDPNDTDDWSNKDAALRAIRRIAVRERSNAPGI